MRSLESEALDRMIFFGEGAPRRTLDQYAAHFHKERNRQGLENRLIDPGRKSDPWQGKSNVANGSVVCCLAITVLPESPKFRDLLKRRCFITTMILRAAVVKSGY